MSVRGIFMSNSGIAGERQNTLSGRILMNGFAGSAPLLALSSGMPEEKISDTAWSWTEDQHVSGASTTTSSYNSSATSIVVADSNLWVPNMLLLVESTGERLFVTAVAGNTITVVRGAFGSTAASIGSAARLQSIGTVFAEADGKPSPVVQAGESYTNLVQIFKNGWSVSGTAKAIGFVTGSKLARNKQMAMTYHAEDIERAFLFGTRGQQVIGGKEYRTSNGIKNMIANYGGKVVSAAYGSTPGNMALLGTASLTNFIRQVFDRNVKGMPNERVCFSSSTILELLQIMVKKDSSYFIESNETDFGFNVTTINFLGNVIKIMTHPLFVENPTWSQLFLVLHPGLIKKKILRPTWSEEFGPEKANNAGIDANEGYVADEMGFHLEGARCMGYIDGWTAGVASA